MLSTELFNTSRSDQKEQGKTPTAAISTNFGSTRVPLGPDGKWERPEGIGSTSDRAIPPTDSKEYAEMQRQLGTTEPLGRYGSNKA